MKGLIPKLLKASPYQISLEVVFWDGEKVKLGQGEPELKIHIKTPRVIKDMAKNLSLGFGEHYMNGNLVVEGDLQKLLKIGLNIKFKEAKIPNRAKFRILLNNVLTLNTIWNVRKNVSHHYDIGNDFYRLMLDKDMTYSCAYFKQENESLEKAQENKHEIICKKIGLKNGDKLLDIGCGWGSFLIYAAKKFDIKAVGCTLAKNQYEYAQKRVQQEGLADRVSILLKDYRQIRGQFNKFVSVGMYEHVGKNFARIFFKKVKSLLTPDGMGLLHTIGHNCAEPTDPWIKRYIFPGGYLPYLSELIQRITEQGFYIIDVENLRAHYAKTLQEWIKRFEGNIGKVQKMFGQRFINMWRLYLNAACAGFKYGESQVYQIVFSPDKGKIKEFQRERIYN